MGDCCSASGHRDQPAAGHPNKRRCPRHGGECAEVSARTIAHHIAQAWAWRATAGRYFYCDDPACEIVYFGDDGSMIDQSRLRTRVGVKDPADDRLLCYCFGVSQADFRRDPATRDFVLAETRAGRCSCETSNPSGRCCLKDFPEADD